MASRTKGKTPPGGKGKSKAPKQPKLALPKKVREKITDLMKKLEEKNDEENSSPSFIPTSIDDANQMVVGELIIDAYKLDRMASTSSLKHAKALRIGESMQIPPRLGNSLFWQWQDIDDEFDWLQCNRWVSVFCKKGKGNYVGRSGFIFV